MESCSTDRRRCGPRADASAQGEHSARQVSTPPPQSTTGAPPSHCRPPATPSSTSTHDAPFLHRSSQWLVCAHRIQQLAPRSQIIAPLLTVSHSASQRAPDAQEVSQLLTPTHSCRHVASASHSSDALLDPSLLTAHTLPGSQRDLQSPPPTHPPTQRADAPQRQPSPQPPPQKGSPASPHPCSAHSAPSAANRGA